MKALILIIFALLVVSCTPQQEETSTIEQTEPKVFEIGEEDTLSWIEESKERRNELNEIRALREDEEDQEEFEKESQYKNVKTVIDDELTIGYDKDLYNPDLKKVDE